MAKLVVKRKQGQGASATPSKTARKEDTIPESPEAEKGALSSILISGGAAVPVCIEHGLTQFHFFNPVNQTLFNLFVELHREGKPIELIGLTQTLMDRKLLNKVGGVGYVTELQSFAASDAALDYYVDILRDKFLRREMIACGNKIARAAYASGEDIADAIQILRKRADQIINGLNGQGRLPNLLDVSTRFGDNHLPEPPEIIRSVLHQGSKIVVGGTSKGRKTFALIDMALSVASGTEWWGFHCKRGPVCYVNFEIQESFFCQRVEVIAKTKGVTLDPGQLLVWNLRGYAQGMERLMDDILMTLCARQFVLVIIDPVYKGLGGRDENKAGDVASLCNELELIAVKTGAAVAFGAHYSKGNQSMKESIDRIGGSGVFARDPDSILTMTPHDELDAFTVEATLRNFKPMSPFVLRWDWPLFIRDKKLDPKQLKEQRSGNAGRFKPRYSKQQLLDYLSTDKGLPGPQLRKILDTKIGMSKSTFYNFKADLLAEGLIIEKGDELWLAEQESPADSNGENLPLEESIGKTTDETPF